MLSNLLIPETKRNNFLSSLGVDLSIPSRIGNKFSKEDLIKIWRENNSIPKGILGDIKAECLLRATFPDGSGEGCYKIKDLTEIHPKDNRYALMREYIGK